ncbi:serine/threonine protein kinase [Anaeromyxobacter sp. Fw109-5]|uniref:serine/threonine protein kinase n=1 Tax=Anaeromyxobacter sp. (strain Fw109-5) TaxID=404589 RepID=UPI0000ED8213|nr:serine/threonine protein kinase [Anaeromyxobacter sp. Fw109-5]ABS25979.1 serine/threonine protein kinase [Anaeromyxobacter sp. Fw109-5]
MPISGHEIVSVLRPGHTYLVRSVAAGTLSVLRRAGVPRRALERRTRAGVVPTLVEHDGTAHVLRPFAPGRSLAELLAAPPDDRSALALADALGAAVVALEARGRAHGRLHPGNAIVSEDGTVVLVDGELPPHWDPADPGTAAALGYTAPEVLRGGPPSRRADAFALAAMTYALLAGRAPFQADPPLEVIRRVIHEDPVPLAVLRPDLPPGLAQAVGRGLSRRRWRRASAAEIAESIRRAAASIAIPTPTSTSTSTPTPTPTATSTSTPTPTPTPTSTATATSTPTPTPTPTSTSTSTATTTATPTPTPTPPATADPIPLLVRQAHHARASDSASPSASLTLRALLSSLSRALPLSSLSPPLRRAALVAVPALALAALCLPPSDAALADEVASLIADGRLADARTKLDAAARTRAGDPLVEKLRGDVACARGASGECLRRYRVALAARPALREDAALRENARRLLAGAQSCGGRRAAAELLGELRDPAALPALEAARRSGGVFSWFCTRDSLDRAIAATRRYGRATTE